MKPEGHLFTQCHDPKKNGHDRTCPPGHTTIRRLISRNSSPSVSQAETLPRCISTPLVKTQLHITVSFSHRQNFIKIPKTNILEKRLAEVNVSVLSTRMHWYFTSRCMVLRRLIKTSRASVMPCSHPDLHN